MRSRFKATPAPEVEPSLANLARALDNAIIARPPLAGLSWLVRAKNALAGSPAAKSAESPALVTADAIGVAEQLGASAAKVRDENSPGEAIDTSAVTSLIHGLSEDIGAEAHRALANARHKARNTIAKARHGRPPVHWLLLTLMVTTTLTLEAMALQQPLADVFDIVPVWLRWTAAFAAAAIFSLAGTAIAKATFAWVKYPEQAGQDGARGKGIAKFATLLAVVSVLTALGGFVWLRVAYADEATASLLDESTDLSLPHALMIGGIVATSISVAFALKTVGLSKDSSTQTIVTAGSERARSADVESAVAVVEPLDGWVRMDAKARSLAPVLAGAFRDGYLNALDPSARDYQRAYELECPPVECVTPNEHPWVRKFVAALESLIEEISTSSLPRSELTPPAAPTRVDVTAADLNTRSLEEWVA